MASVSSQLIAEVTAYAQSDSLEDAREICADGTYFPNNLRTSAKLPQFLPCFSLQRCKLAMKLAVVATVIITVLQCCIMYFHDGDLPRVVE